MKQLKPFQGEVDQCAEIAAYVKRESFATEMKDVLGYGDQAQQKSQVCSIIKMFNTL